MHSVEVGKPFCTSSHVANTQNEWAICSLVLRPAQQKDIGGANITTLDLVNWEAYQYWAICFSSRHVYARWRSSLRIDLFLGYVRCKGQKWVHNCCINSI
jgi:hypothetical protein